MSPRRSKRLSDANSAFLPHDKPRLSFSPIQFFYDCDEYPVIQRIPAKRTHDTTSTTLTSFEERNASQTQQMSEDASPLHISGTLGTSTLNFMNLDGAVASIFGRPSTAAAEGDSRNLNFGISSPGALPTPEPSPDVQSSSEQPDDLADGERYLGVAVDMPEDDGEAAQGGAGEHAQVVNPLDLRAASDLAAQELVIIPKIMAGPILLSCVRPALGHLDNVEVFPPTASETDIDSAPITKLREREDEQEAPNLPSRRKADGPKTGDMTVSHRRHRDSSKTATTKARKRRTHKHNDVPGGPEVPATANSSYSLSGNTNSLAEYRRRMLGRHRRTENWRGCKSTFVTIRRDWH